VSQDLRQIQTAREAVDQFSYDGLWRLFDGDAEHLNIATECLDRHPSDTVAARLAHADGRYEELSFGELSELTSRFAHLLVARGVARGATVGVLMEPSRAFYTALFGVIKMGAVAVPLYTLFGPQAVRDRLDDCGAELLLVDRERVELARDLGVEHLLVDGELIEPLAGQPARYEPDTASSDLAVLQYTSGTTRQLPDAVRHDHRSVVTLARAGLFALGLRAGDRYFCPSSPAWGHGLWHGTIAPWSLGVAVGAYSGRFSTERLITALRELQITNLAAASTIYRMILDSPRAGELSGLRKASYTGEELSSVDQQRFSDATGVSVCGMYGTTETGVIIVNFPGFTDHEPKAGALGKPMPGCTLTVLGDDDEPVPTGATGEISLWRRGGWFRSKDLGSVDSDGFYHYLGRADDVIISAGWTISPLEVERTLLTHPGVRDAAVIGTPDPTRGQIVTAFLVADRQDAGFVSEIQEFVQTTLSRHEYPRKVEFLDELPHTVNGKIDRKTLRNQFAARVT
jgi:acetyl-CoA synthetase